MRPVLPALALGLPGWTGNLEETKTSSWSECTFFQQKVAVVTVSGWRLWCWWHCPSWVVFSGVTLAVLSGASFLWFLLVGRPDSPGFLSILLTTWWLSNNFFFCLLNRVNFWCQKPRTLTGTASVPLQDLGDWCQHWRGKRRDQRKQENQNKERELGSRKGWGLCANVGGRKGRKVTEEGKIGGRESKGIGRWGRTA